MSNLPLKLMNIKLSKPRPDLFNRLKKLKITEYLNKYDSLEDLARAYDGAFTATHIELQIKSDEPIVLAYIKILRWYEFYHNNLNSPFYDGLKTTLIEMNLEWLYKNAIDYIIDNKGKLENI